MNADKTYTAFLNNSLIGHGELEVVWTALQSRSEAHQGEIVLIFDDVTGKQVDIDLTAEPQLPAGRGPGRPRLGVVAREVTLLPRHWDWLANQPNGASAALRRLVDAARRGEGAAEIARRTAAATGRVMTALAGNQPNFEEAYRSLDAGDRARFTELISGWSADVQAYLLQVSQAVFAADDGPELV